MIIKNLVISGGAAIGFSYFGAIRHLIEKSYFNLENIENVYCTSVGCIISVSIILNYDLSIVEDYFVNRPWHELFKISPMKIIETYQTKGLFGKHHIDEFLKPLLKGKNLEVDITLKQLYEYSKINLYINCVEVDENEGLKHLTLSWKTHPDLKVSEAIQMTSCIPLLIQPLILNNKYILDGGFLTNYNSYECLQSNKEEETFGIRYELSKMEKTEETILDNDSINIFHFLSMCHFKINHYIKKHITEPHLKNELVIPINISPLDTTLLKNIMSNKDVRKEWIENGKTEAVNYLTNR